MLSTCAAAADTAAAAEPAKAAGPKPKADAADPKAAAEPKAAADQAATAAPPPELDKHSEVEIDDLLKEQFSSIYHTFSPEEKRKIFDKIKEKLKELDANDPNGGKLKNTSV